MGLDEPPARDEGARPSAADPRTPGPRPRRDGPPYQRLLLPWRSIEVQRRLEERLDRPVQLAVTANRSSLIRVLPELGSTRVRLHSMFLYAPLEVLDALARYARRPHDLEANEILDAFIRGEAHRIVEPVRGPELVVAPPRPAFEPEPRARGERFDLEEIFHELNGRFFGGLVVARISWSRGVAQRRRRSILFGSYMGPPTGGERHGLIKIHPALDAEWVPRGFVEFVVHHEMLHAVIPTRIIRGRRAFHPPEFRKRERAYPSYRDWRRWEKDNLARFLGKLAAAAGPPLDDAADLDDVDDGFAIDEEWWGE